MDGYVYARAAEPADIRALLSKPPANLAYIMQESASDLEFRHFVVPGEKWQPWDAGRAFGRDMEVRWQRLKDGKFQMLVLSETPQLALEDWPAPRVMTAKAGSKVYLWGRERSYLTGDQRPVAPSEWVQASIPRLLRYPLDDRKEFAFIEALHYRQGGIIVLTRFCGLSGENQEEASR